MEKRLDRRPLPTPSPGDLMTAALLLLALFLVLSASGSLLAPLFGQAAGVFDYLHGFAHDGRHLLGVPCH